MPSVYSTPDEPAMAYCRWVKEVITVTSCIQLFRRRRIRKTIRPLDKRCSFLEQIKNPESIVTDSGFKEDFGGVLLSHTASRAVPSALRSLTSVFGMGTGVASSQLPPKNDYSSIFNLHLNMTPIYKFSSSEPIM